MTTKKIATLGVLTALYVVLSAFLKFSLFGNIMIDLGYITFAVALCTFGIYGTIVGVIGCALESILFSAYGFSISWVCANLTIGIICGLTFPRFHKNIWKYIIACVAVAIAMIGVKTIIECNLYNIPLAVKIPKNLVAFYADSITMVLGIGLYDTLKHRVNLRA